MHLTQEYCQFKSEQPHKFEHHLYTSDPSFVQHDSLRHTLLLGPRPCKRQGSSHETEANIRHTLNEIPLDILPQHKQAVDHRQWVKRVIRDVRTRLPGQAHKPPHIPNWTRHLKTLQSDVVITQADKANSLFFLCPKIYRHMLCKHVSSSTYCKPSIPKATILANFKQRQDAILGNTPPLFDKLGSLYLTIKTHKELSKPRPIVDTRDSYSVFADRTLTTSLNAIQSTLLASNEHQTILKSTLDLVTCIPHKVTCAHSFDVKGAYDALKHDLIKTKISRAIDIAFMHNKDQHIKIIGKARDKFLWVSNTRYTPHDHNRLKADQVKQLLALVIEHAYIEIGDDVLHQTEGVAMGSMCGPVVLNLTLFMIECEIDSNHPHLEWMSRYVRLQDDILIVNIGKRKLRKYVIPTFAKYGLELEYTPCLPDAPTSFPYLDLLIKVEQGCLTFTRYFKADHLPLGYNVQITPKSSMAKPTQIEDNFYGDIITTYRNNSDVIPFLMTLRRRYLQYKAVHPDKTHAFLRKINKFFRENTHDRFHIPAKIKRAIVVNFRSL